MTATTYRIYEETDNGTTGQDVGEFAYADLPARMRAAIDNDPESGEWTMPALSDGDAGEELDDLTTAVRAQP